MQPFLMCCLSRMRRRKSRHRPSSRVTTDTAGLLLPPPPPPAVGVVLDMDGTMMRSVRCRDVDASQQLLNLAVMARNVTVAVPSWKHWQHVAGDDHGRSSCVTRSPPSPDLVDDTAAVLVMRPHLLSFLHWLTMHHIPWRVWSHNHRENVATFLEWVLLQYHLTYPSCPVPSPAVCCESAEWNCCEGTRRRRPTKDVTQWAWDASCSTSDDSSTIGTGRMMCRRWVLVDDCFDVFPETCPVFVPSTDATGHDEMADFVNHFIPEAFWDDDDDNNKVSTETVMMVGYYADSFLAAASVESMMDDDSLKSTEDVLFQVSLQQHM